MIQVQEEVLYNLNTPPLDINQLHHLLTAIKCGNEYFGTTQKIVKRKIING